MSTSRDSHNLDDTEKYKKYKAEYTQRLMAKYFSDKNIHGGNVFEKVTTIDNETIKASRSSCLQSYADPVGTLGDQKKASASTGESSANFSSKKQKSN